MASSSSLKASSSTSNCDGYNYHVFLSFRGEDTRQTFTGHLYANLVARGIHTFRDDEELEKGGDIASDLSKAMEESRIFIVIFSEYYATSKWCLNELVKIIDCMTEKKSVVLPVFYHVEPTDVRNQGGSFEDAFLEHAKDADQEKKKTIETWKNALKTAANLSGYHLQNQSEAEFIQRICEDIVIRLNRTPLDMGYNIVGMDFHLKRLQSLIKVEIDEVLMVGIYGIGGIGKTTISKAIYNNISSQFDGSSFLGNVGGKCEDGLLKLQKTLLQDILKCKRPKFNDICQGITVIKERLRSKRVLIVLDDVDNYMQLENLAGKYGWYGAKSIIIITTKDKHLLTQHGVKALYEVDKLNDEESAELFNWYAFKQNTPKTGFERLSDSVVKYSQGLPIALKVLGGFLYNKSIDEWKCELYKLEKIPHMTVQSVLKVSYDKLDHTCQEIFLDIACFFRGKDKDFVSRILGSYAMMGIKVLNDRCLLTISENKLDMHDLVQQMGQEIVRQECLKEPGNRSRLWDHNDVDSVLTRNTGTQAIEGLFVQGSLASQISTNSFTKMNRLRLLKVYHSWFWMKNYQLKDLDFPFSELRYFHFHGYPLESLPTNFHAKNLVELNLKCSNIKRLWKGNEILDNLKVINLSYSTNLVEISDFSRVTNLEILILKDCESLKSFPAIKGDMSKLREIDLSFTSIEELPSSIGHLKALKHLDLSYCESLRSLSESFCNLSSLETLTLKACLNLKGFPEIKDDMENLERLDLGETGIEGLPSSIGRLKALKHLDLGYCAEPVSLPDSICNLSSLKTLNVQECPNLERVEVNLVGSLDLTCCILKQRVIWWSNNLRHDKVEGEVLNHHVSSLSSLVESCTRDYRGIGGDRFHLSALKVLSAGNFSPIQRRILSDIFRQSSLKSVSLRNCNLMEEEGIPSDIWNLSSLVNLSLSNCSLTEGEILNHICHISSLQNLSLDGNHFSSIPAGISRLSNLRALNLSHCNKLQQIPELPSSLRDLNLSHCKKLQEIPELPLSLRFLDAHCSDGISSGSSLLSIRPLVNCFKSELIQGGWTSVGASSFESRESSIVMPRSSGILEGIRNQSMGSDVTIELPQNWYDNDNLLGFALCFVCVPVLDDELNFCPLDFYCKLAIKGNDLLKDMDKVLFKSGCCCFKINDDSVSDLAWVIYYPKDTFEGQYHSKQWTHFMASFHGRRTFEVKECGIHPIYGCFICQPNEECQRKLCLKGHAINELPFIDRPFELDSLCLRECQNLESLPSTICELKSLTTLSCSGCSQLKIFPEILETLENLRELHLDGTAIEELPASIQHVRGLQSLYLAYCNNLVSLPQTICNLKSLEFLSCSGCSQLKSFPEILENMENLRKLHLDGTAIEELPASIQLSELRVLDLSHCQKLLQIPELPQSLRFLDAHGCPCLETLSSPSSSLGFSLFKCFKSAIEEFECGSYWSKEITVFIPGNNGIPEWISYKKKGFEIATELPENWWEDNNFLGFALCSVFVPLHTKSKEDPCSLKCEMNFHFHQFEYLDGFSSKFWSVDELSFRRSYLCCHNGGESNRVWVAYYPKVAIENKHWSNESRHLKASFYGERVKVEECGLHLIYKTNILNKDSNATNHWPRLLSENTNFNVKRSLDDAENPHNKKSRLL